MTRAELEQRIVAASKYRSGPDSCNSLYMGSMATATLMNILGGTYAGRRSIFDLVKKATEHQLYKALEYCKPYLDSMDAKQAKIDKSRAKIEPIAADKAAGFLRGAADYFDQRTKSSEDAEIWAYVYNAENCRRVADLVEAAIIGHPIGTAPKDRPILAWCDHEADPRSLDDTGKKLTLYAAHAEGLSHAPTGYHIVEWGGAWADSQEDGGGNLPDWWFVVGSEFEQAANPVRWWPLPPDLPRTPEKSND